MNTAEAKAEPTRRTKEEIEAAKAAAVRAKQFFLGLEPDWKGVPVSTEVILYDALTCAEAEIEDLKGRIRQDHGVVESMEVEMNELRNAGGLAYLRSEAIRNARDELAAERQRRETAERELKDVKEQLGLVRGAFEDYHALTDNEKLVDERQRAEKAERELERCKMLRDKFERDALALFEERDSERQRREKLLSFIRSDPHIIRLRDTRNRLLERVASSEAEMAEAQKDTERIDWLCSQCEPVICGHFPDGEPEHVANQWHLRGPFGTVREAIDAARDAGKGNT